MRLIVLQRLGLLVPTLVVVAIAVFSLIHAIPGDPAELVLGLDATERQIEEVRRELGLDRPLTVQFVRWLSRAILGDFGVSNRSKQPVLTEVLPRFAATLELAGASLFLGLVVGTASGVAAALARNSVYDTAILVAAVVGISMPRFWLGMVLLLVFSVMLDLFPSGGRGGLAHLALPAITFGWSAGALIARTTRASMLEVLDRDYIRTARAKGLRESVVVVKHALRPALLPVATVLGLQFGFLLAGSVVVEIVFTWPGVGTLLVDSILSRDYPVVQGVLLLLAVMFVLVNLAVDLLYLVIDPRISQRYGAAAN